MLLHGVGGAKSLPPFHPDSGVGLRVRKRTIKQCGDIFRRIHWNNHGCKSVVWRCASRLEKTAADCSARTVRELDLKKAIAQAINNVFGVKTEFIDILNKNIAVSMNQVDETAIAEIDKKLGQLQKELLRLANSKEDYSVIAEEIYRLRGEKETAMVKNSGYASQKQRMSEMTDFLKQQKCIIEEYDEQLVRKLVDTITIFDEKLTVTFKSGLMVNLEM